MPILNELRRLLTDAEDRDMMECSSDETFVSDNRSGLRSTQVIDRKVGFALARDGELTEGRKERFRRYPK